MKTSQNNKLSFKGQRLYIGIDVHKKNWSVTIRNNHRVLKTLSMDPTPETLNTYLRRNYPEGEYYSVYEAGFCGWWIHRGLCKLGIINIVINPADVPTSQKQKIRKTDKVDSRKLSEQLEQGGLEAIYVPTEKEQGERSLSRLREQTKKDRTRLKNQIMSFINYSGKKIDKKHSKWSKEFLKQLRELEFNTEEEKYHLETLLVRLEDINKILLEIFRKIRAKEKQITEFQSIRSVPGVGYIVAYTLYAELNNMERFKTDNQLAAMVGLIPNTDSSGEKDRTTGITFRANKYLRSIIIEAAWKAVSNDPALTMCYNEFIKRMSSQKAIIRIAKKLLFRIRSVWKNKTKYCTGLVVNQ